MNCAPIQRADTSECRSCWLHKYIWGVPEKDCKECLERKWVEVIPNYIEVDEWARPLER